MRSVHDHSIRGDESAVGVDFGATLVKLAFRDGRAEPRFSLVSADEPEAVAQAVVEAGPAHVGLTGCGAPTLARLLSLDTAAVGEFDAWGAGAAALLGSPPDERYLLVSVGTGTSMMLCGPDGPVRIGGTALGGGTLMGLSHALIGPRDFEEICGLARRGDRRRVDLTLADLYPTPADSPLPPDLTASAFARLSRSDGAGARPEDLAHALMGLVGENVAIIAASLAAAAGVERLVFAGSTLRGNPALREILTDIVGRFARAPSFLENGEFGGALGALLLATGP